MRKELLSAAKHVSRLTVLLLILISSTPLLKKRVLMVAALLAVLTVASFYSPSAAATNNGFLASFNTQVSNPHFADLGISAANITDSTSATAYSNFCKVCSTVSVSSINIANSGSGSMYFVLVSVNTSSPTCGALSDTLSQKFTLTDTAHSSTGAATVCGYNEGTITATGTDAISITGLSLNYNIEMYVYVLSGYSNATMSYNTGNDATCTCSPTIVQIFYNYVGVNPGWFAAGAYDSTGLTNVPLTYELGTMGIGAGTQANQDIGFGGEYFISTGPSTVTTTAPGPCCVQVGGEGVETTTAISTATVSTTITQVRSSSVKSILTIVELSSPEWLIVIVVIVAAILASAVVLVRVRTHHF